MTAKLFTVPSPVAFNSRGLAVPGATAHLYTTGTTTPQNFYSDQALTISLGSSITADAIGRFPVCYQDADTAYRLIILDQDGAELADVDPYYFGMNSLTENSVILAALEDISADKVLGRDSSGSGPVQQITFTSFARSMADDTTAAAVRNTLGLGTSATMDAEWVCNFTDDGDLYIAAIEAMTIDQGNAAIGTGTITFQASTNATPDSFSSTSLPTTLEAGAWLKVTAASVSGFCATHLVRTA